MRRQIENIARHAEVSEKAIERYLAERVKAMGGVCLKYSNPGMTGYPDRLCVMPEGKTIWVELKSRGRKPEALQEVRFRQLESLGHTVYVCDSREKVDEVLSNYE
jgi:hypothetical protein